MKKTLKKLVVCLLIVLMIFNFMMSNIGTVYAEETETEQLNTQTEAAIATLVAGVADGFAGVFTWFMRAGAVVVSTMFQIGTYYVLISGETSTTSSISSSIYLTPYDIFFNNFALTNINIFQTNDVETGSFVANMRNNFAACFLIFETIALILLTIKFFIGVARQFLINTSADEKRAGAELATDSAISFLLVILMSSIILVIILLNETILNAIGQIGSDVLMDNLLIALRTSALSLSYTLGMAGTIAIILLTFYTIKFAIAYILRFITVAFLIMIAPLMPVFFSMSKAKSGAPSALNRWLRIFISNVFIQSIHALIYTTIIIFPFAAISSAPDTLEAIGDLLEPFLLIIGLIFIKQIEKFIVTLFGIDDDVASLSMINREIHNVTNSVKKVALAGASVYTAATGNTIASSALVNFGKNVESSETTNNNNVKIHGPSYNGIAANGVVGAIGSVAALDYATDHPNGSSFEEDDEARRNRDRAREEREAYEEKMRQKNQEGEQSEGENKDGNILGGNNQEQIEDKNDVLLLPPVEETEENDAEEIAEQALEDAIDTVNEENNLEENDNETEEELFDESENNEEISEDIKTEIELTPEQAEERTEIQDKYNELLEDIKAAKELQEGLIEALQESQSKIGDEKGSEIKETMDDLYKDKGFEGAKDYAMSLGDGEEGDFAKMYLVYLDEKNALDEMVRSDDTDGGILNLVDKGIDDGVITVDEGEELMNNAINVADGKGNESGNIFGKIKSKKSENSNVSRNQSKNKDQNDESSETIEVRNSEKSDSESATTQVVEKKKEIETQEDIRKPKMELSAVADIPTSILNKALKTSVVKSVIKRSSENISAVKGGITTGGTITGESLARIINDMEDGAYSEENYKKVKGAAISAGESDNIERFDRNPTSENAAACGNTEAGREYVTFTEERAVGSSLLTTSTLMNTSNQPVTNNTPAATSGVGNTINSLQNKKANV